MIAPKRETEKKLSTLWILGAVAATAVLIAVATFILMHLEKI